MSTLTRPNVGVLNNIQAMRGIASLVVFVGHGLLLMPGIGLDRYFSFFGVAASGGVDIFFVISGFIITTVAMKESGSDGRLVCAWNFGVKRAVRIYPVYWLVFLLALGMSAYVNFAPPVTDIKPVWQQFLLLTHVNSYIMAAWSLAFEIYFYGVVVVALLISPRHVGKVLFAWAAVTVFIIFYDYGIGEAGLIGSLPFSPLILEFIMGMVVAWIIRSGKTGFAVASGLFGVCFFLAGSEIMRSLGWSDLNPWYRTFYNGLPSAFIIYSVVAIEIRGMWTFSHGWVKLGDASYSLYIWHQFIFYSIYTVLVGKAWVAGVNPLLLVCVWLVPAFIFGLFSYSRIEIPLQRWLNSRLLIRPGDSPKVGLTRRLITLGAAAALILSVSLYGWTEERRGRDFVAAGHALSEKIQAAGPAEPPFTKASLEGGAAAAGLTKDDALRGHFDGIYKGPRKIRVHGWAADINGKAADLKVLIYDCRGYIGVVPLGKSRPDVADSLQIAEKRSGFTADLDADHMCDSKLIVGLVSDGSRFSVIEGTF